MSRKNIRQALEVRLYNLVGHPPIAFENTDFPAPVGPFLSSNILFAEPDDKGYKDAPYIQRGILTIGLHYPLNVGTKDADNMAESIANWFKRGSSFEANGTTVKIDRSPSVSGGSVEDKRYTKRVSIRFWAEIDPSQV